MYVNVILFVADFYNCALVLLCMKQNTDNYWKSIFASFILNQGSLFLCDHQQQCKKLVNFCNFPYFPSKSFIFSKESLEITCGALCTLILYASPWPRTHSIHLSSSVQTLCTSLIDIHILNCFGDLIVLDPTYLQDHAFTIDVL